MLLNMEAELNPLRPELCFRFLKNIKVHSINENVLPMDIRSKQVYFPKMYQHKIN